MLIYANLCVFYLCSDSTVNEGDKHLNKHQLITNTVEINGVTLEMNNASILHKVCLHFLRNKQIKTNALEDAVNTASPLAHRRWV